MKIRTMTTDDYDAVMNLLQATNGVRLRDADSREAIARYLDRNPNLSYVALVEGDLAGCIMCGHDGRRGYLQHLAVSVRHRRQGIGTALVESCLAGLEELGILKSHIDILIENRQGCEFWSRLGWQKRNDIFRYSFVRGRNANA